MDAAIGARRAATIPGLAGDWSGLSEAEVGERRAGGQTNAAGLPTSRSYLEIVRENVLTFINAVLFGLAVALVVMGRASDALVSIGVVGVNLAVGVTQEIYAKRVLDRIALLARPLATVIRQGRERQIDPDEVVLGDLLLARSGDQVLVDGTVRSATPADFDESLLSGESDSISKHTGDSVYAGSWCVSGSVVYEAQKVGTDSLANQLAASARAFRRILTPLQREIDRVVRVSVVLVIVFEVLSALAALLDGTPVVDSVRMAVVIAGLIPNGLFLAIAVTYGMGAVRLAGRGILVQQANAIESLWHVDVLCMDKTGTLTTNRFRLADVLPIGIDEPQLRRLLGLYAASSSDSNRTIETLRQTCPSERWSVADEVPFSSERKWSGLVLNEAGVETAYVIGAPEILALHLGLEQHLPGQADEWTDRGLRVLLFGSASATQPLHAPDGEPRLPIGLRALGLVSFSDELRTDARDTLAGFAAAGVELKLLSGDDPRTVHALAVQAGLIGKARLVRARDGGDGRRWAVGSGGRRIGVWAACAGPEGADRRRSACPGTLRGHDGRWSQ